MTFWSRLFGTAKPSRPQQRKSATSSATPAHLRRELVSTALRDTLIRHGIPTSWLGVEMQPFRSSQGETYFHVRLMLKHWEPRLLVNALALQQSFARRVAIFDAKSANWMRGIAWQFALPAGVAAEMPPAAVWKVPEEPAQEPVVDPIQHSQLEKLRELMLEGDVSRRLPHGAVDFQNTMPFELAETEARV